MDAVGDHILARDLAVGANHQHVRAGGVAQQARLRHQEGIGLLSERSIQGHVSAGQQGPVRIRDACAHRDRAGRGIDHITGEIQLAGVLVRGAVGQDHLHLDRVRRTPGHGATDLLEFGHTQREVHVQRIDLVDRRQQRCLVLADQRALGHLLLASAAVDRRTNGGVAEVDAGIGEHRVGLLDRGAGAAFGGQCVVEVGLGDELGRRQPAGTVCGDLGVGVVGFGRGQRRLRLAEFGLQLRRIDPEQHLAGFHVGAFLVDAPLQHTRHACARVGAAKRGEPADQILLQWHGAGTHLDDADFRRRRRALGLFVAAG